MFSEKDFERLWFLYKTEGEPKGVSINSFCISNNIPYTAFYDWFKKTQKKVVLVEVESIPEELIQTGNEEQDVTKEKSKRTSPHKGSIMVTISRILCSTASRCQRLHTGKLKTVCWILLSRTC